MSVELKVTLVGDDPQQQQAFNQPSTAPAASSSQADHSTATAPSQPASSQGSTTPNASSAATQSTAPDVAQPPPVFSTEMRLIDTLEELIRALDGQTDANKPAGTGSEPKAKAPQNWFERFSETVNKKLDELGLANTSIGNLVSGASNAFSGLGTRATKFASSVFGRGAGAAATTAGTEAAGAAAAGAGVEAGAGAAAGAGATAAASAAGPLILVALAAGAAALSVKKFMEAVDSVAKDLADLSPDIAVGQAQSDMRLELARLDRARRVGPEVAGLNNAQNRLQESMYELQTKFYELVLKFSPFIETGVNILDLGVSKISLEIASVSAALALFTPNPDDDKKAAEAVQKAAEDMKNAAMRLAGLQTPDDAKFENMIEAMLGFGPEPQQGNQPPPIARRK